MGFTPEEVLVEVERRGVLRRPDLDERTHILSLPRGERLLDAMESPRNLLAADALILFGRRQAGAPNLEQWKAGRVATVNNITYATQAQYQSDAARKAQFADYQRRRNDLTMHLFALKKRRAEMQRRGEMTVSITIEIECLEREVAALTPPR